MCEVELSFVGYYLVLGFMLARKSTKNFRALLQKTSHLVFHLFDLIFENEPPIID